MKIAGFTGFASARLQRKQAWRWLLPILLVLLFLSILIWLPWQVRQMEVSERQEQLIADTLWVEQAIRFQLSRNEENFGQVGAEIANGYLPPDKLRERTMLLLKNSREIQRVMWLDATGAIVASSDLRANGPPRLSQASAEVSANARKLKSAQYSQPVKTVSAAGVPGLTLMDCYLPIFNDGQYSGSLVIRYALQDILNEMVPWWFAQDNEIVLTDNDDAVFAMRAAGGLGRGVYTHRHTLELPGAAVYLRTNSVKSAPTLLPNLLVGSIILLSLGLIWSLWALWRDINRRLAAEGALREQVAFRMAMENSLVTGLRARDLKGRISYVNPAFCRMVGLSADQLLNKAPPMPYWAPEAIEDYEERFAQVLAGTVQQHGFEIMFQRASGERFPVLIYESPLLDDSGRQTGWMGSILDISDRKKVEELNRQQQEKLQSSARLATMGELASTLAHELNQPLAAISSYTAGAINLMQSGVVDAALLQPALEKANAQVQRAGLIIRSVHEFVKRREPTREPVSMENLIDSVMPLIELQAQQCFVAIQVSIAPGLPAVLADRVMLEQVLLNLTRNAIEAMQQVPSERRILRISVSTDRVHPDTEPAPANVIVSVIDQGHGIAPEVAEHLFSPFFSTKAEGMGIGLKICRTTLEFHGGTLNYVNNPLGGTIFRFSLPPHLPE
ncbi:MAG: PAS domain S-box protein [Oxalobacteraceae bacterium]|nr:PAS domain S-box protein [Oxalobacteraceae bacterium]